MGKYVYVDNSNIWIEGKYHSAVKKGMIDNVFDAHASNLCDQYWSYDFGKLLNVASSKSVNDVKKAVLFGSKPTDKDSLWQSAVAKGYQVITANRNASNKEKRVDTGFAAAVLKDLYKEVHKSDEIILCAGDSDFFPVIQNILEEDIKVTVVFWSNVADSLKKDATNFICLDDYIEEIQM